MHQLIKDRLVLCIVLIIIAARYTLVLPKAVKDTSKHTLVTTEGRSMLLKDENGKILTQTEAYNMLVTGKYLMVKAVDKNKVPYILVQRKELVDRSHWKYKN